MDSTRLPDLNGRHFGNELQMGNARDIYPLRYTRGFLRHRVARHIMARPLGLASSPILRDDRGLITRTVSKVYVVVLGVPTRRRFGAPFISRIRLDLLRVLL